MIGLFFIRLVWSAYRNVDNVY